MSNPQPQFLIGGCIDPNQFGAFMPPGTDTKGQPLPALLIVSPTGLALLRRALIAEAVLGAIQVDAPLVLATLELCRVELRMAPTEVMPWPLLVISAAGYQAQTLGFIAAAAQMAHQIVPERPVVAAPEVPDA